MHEVKVKERQSKLIFFLSIITPIVHLFTQTLLAITIPIIIQLSDLLFKLHASKSMKLVSIKFLI